MRKNLKIMVANQESCFNFMRCFILWWSHDLTPVDVTLPLGYYLPKEDFNSTVCWVSNMAHVLLHFSPTDRITFPFTDLAFPQSSCWGAIGSQQMVALLRSDTVGERKDSAGREQDRQPINNTGFHSQVRNPSITCIKAFQELQILWWKRQFQVSYTYRRGWKGLCCWIGAQQSGEELFCLPHREWIANYLWALAQCQHFSICYWLANSQKISLTVLRRLSKSVWFRFPLSI